MLTFQLKQETSLPIDATGFLPETCDSLEKASRFPLWVGNQRVDAADLFTIRGEPADRHWRLEGGGRQIHHLGDGMSAGRITVAGDIGRHAGARMKGGQVVVHGAAGDLLGAEMRGGQITTDGDAGHSVGGAYPGSRLGMRGGAIVVHGRVGDNAGEAMRRGLVVVAGAAGSLAGYRMRAGTILVLGECGPQAGLEMQRGSLGLLGADRTALPRSFRRACRVAPQVLALLRSHIETITDASLGRRIPHEVDLYNGDLLHGGRGEVFTL